MFIMARAFDGCPACRVLSAKSIGLTIALADITEEDFRLLELIEAERQKRIRTGGKRLDEQIDGHAKQFGQLLGLCFTDAALAV